MFNMKKLCYCQLSSVLKKPLFPMISWMILCKQREGKKKRDRRIVLNEEAPDGTRLFSFRKTLLAGNKRGDEG